MPYKDPTQKRVYQRQWQAAKRKEVRQEQPVSPARLTERFVRHEDAVAELEQMVHYLIETWTQSNHGPQLEVMLHRNGILTRLGQIRTLYQELQRSSARLEQLAAHQG